MRQKGKLGVEKKVKIVKRYLAGAGSISSAAAEAGVDQGTIRRWVMQYEAEGIGAFLPSRRNHEYSPELKLQAGACADDRELYPLLQHQTGAAQFGCVDSDGEA